MTDTTTLPLKRLRASLYAGDAFWARRTAVTGSPAAAFVLAIIAVLILYALSGNTLDHIGWGYSKVGGNPFFKVHPSSYFIAIAVVVTLSSSRSSQERAGLLLSKAPSLLVFVSLIAGCIVFAATHVGLIGVGLYVDTYFPAAAIAVVMINASDRQRAILARLILALSVINVVIALAENIHQEHFIPMEFKGPNGRAFTDAQSAEFRPAALYTHPLAGAMATSFAIFLLLETDLGFVTAGISFVLLAVGLLTFGGRAALVTTFAVLGLRITITFVRDMLRRRLNMRLIAVVLASIVVLGPLSGFLLTETSVGSRLAATEYIDDSAKVRVLQWYVLDHMTPQQMMYGVPAGDLEQLYWQVGLDGIENPLLLLFLNLGFVGLPLLIAALIAFTLYLGRSYPASRWLLLAALVILSSSNSIGVKSPDLFMLTACAVSMRGSARVVFFAGPRLRRRHWDFAHVPTRSLGREVLARATAMKLSDHRRGLSPTVVRGPEAT